jgi:hypothetical protein
MCPIQTTTNLDAPFLYNVNAEEEQLMPWPPCAAPRCGGTGRSRSLW